MAALKQFSQDSKGIVKEEIEQAMKSLGAKFSKRFEAKWSDFRFFT
jgi:hypothetical protein